MLREPDAESLIWMDNAFVPWNEASLPVTANHYGIGIFEGVRSYDAKGGPAIFRLEAHTKRLFQSAQIIKIPMCFSPQQLDQAQCDTVRLNHLQNAYLRPFVYYTGIMGLSLGTDALTPHTMIMAASWTNLGFKELTLAANIKCISLQTSSLLRAHPNSLFLKAKANGNYMNSVLARQEAHLSGADDALLLDSQGFAAEASGANIFIVRDACLYTPTLTSALPGITRDTVFVIAKELGLTVAEKQITRDEIYIADEVFLTGTAAEITPVVSVDHRQIGNGRPGNITQQLRTCYLSYAFGICEDKHHWLTYVSAPHSHVNEGQGLATRQHH